MYQQDNTPRIYSQGFGATGPGPSDYSSDGGRPQFDESSGILPPIMGVGRPGMGPPPTSHYFPPGTSEGVAAALSMGGSPGMFPPHWYATGGGRMDYNPGQQHGFQQPNFGGGVHGVDYHFQGGGHPGARFPNPGPAIQTTASKKGPEGANLFIFHVPNDMTNQTMFDLFSPFGTLLSVRIMVEKDTGRSRGFGFVSYDNRESAAAAIKALNGHPIGNKRLKVQHKQTPGSGPMVHVGGGGGGGGGRKQQNREQYDAEIAAGDDFDSDGQQDEPLQRRGGASGEGGPRSDASQQQQQQHVELRHQSAYGDEVDDNGKSSHRIPPQAADQTGQQPSTSAATTTDETAFPSFNLDQLEQNLPDLDQS